MALSRIASIYTGSIILIGDRNDYGEHVHLSEPIHWLDTNDRYDYWKAPEGVFKRSVNYFPGSPYGYQRVLPNHMDKWGMQT